MLLHISEHSAQTLQEQIIGQLRARILSGDLQADQALPSIRGLSKELKVSVITVQRAYEHLLNEQIIYARRGKGFFVAPMKQGDKSELAQQRFAERLFKLMKEARQDGLGDKQIKKIFAKGLEGGIQSDDA